VVPLPMNARALVVLAAAVAGVALTARLGLWQLDRAAQKTALQQALAERGAQPPLDTDAIARDAAGAAQQHHRRAVVRGRWLDAHTVYLDNRQMNGRPGFFAVTPLALADGSALLVQRGWLPRDFSDRTRVQAPPLPQGEVTVAGRIAPGPSRLYEFEGGSEGRIRQNLEIEAFARETHLDLRPLSLVQEEGTPPLADGLLREWPQPAAGVAKHHGYAAQWFALSALILGLYVWFQLLRPRRRPRSA
jgi:surfeit locus 1 family protein